MKNLKSEFSEYQLQLLGQMGYNLNNGRDYSVDEMQDMEDSIADYLVIHGFDENYNPNDLGVACESMIDIFSKLLV